MKIFFFLAICVTWAAAQYPNALPNSHYSQPQSYSAPFQNQQSAYGEPQQSYQHQAPQQYQSQVPSNSLQQPESKIVFKHVFVHVAKDDEPQNQQIRTIKGPGGNEKHVKIIFVKAPAAAAPDQQVVELAQANERKTLVYVLLKKAADAPNVKFANPAPTSASKPEVYFIRYKDEKAKQEYGVPASNNVPKGNQQEYGAPTNTPTSARPGGY